MNSLLLHLRSHDFVNLHPSQRQFDQSEGGGWACGAGLVICERFGEVPSSFGSPDRTNSSGSVPFRNGMEHFWHNFCSSIGPAPPIQP